MTRKQPLKAILSATREQWNSPGVRPDVRQNFEKVLQCRTKALGGEVYASEVEEKVVWHTCKSRACPSCGHLATLNWLDGIVNSLPDVPFVMVTLTMPDVLWPLFQRNRHLLRDLPALGAAVLKSIWRVRHHVRPMIIAIPHTFGGTLNFNCHLHVLVSAGGLDVTAARWIDIVPLDREELMRSWRDAVITYLQKAWEAGLIFQHSNPSRIPSLLRVQSFRRWIVHITGLGSKKQLIRYAGRYLHRLPIAQNRIVSISDEEVVFRAKDRKRKQTLIVTMPTREFVKRLADQVPDFYRHTVRYFGLLAPSARSKTRPGISILLGQTLRTPNRKALWRARIRADFGRDPLKDRHNNLMRWKRRIAPMR